MGFFKNIFGTKHKPIETKEEFWDWFASNESEFGAAVRTKDAGQMERRIFGPLAQRLNELRPDSIFFQMGMADSSTAELVLTPEGIPKNIGFTEELVAAAPQLTGWMFTALKRPEKSTYIELNGLAFGVDTLQFYPNDHADMPDLVDITIVHEDFGGSSDDTIKRGTYLFLDNFLGELDFLTKIDEISFANAAEAEKPLIPLDALPNFLDTRAALFIEKYDGVRLFTENDSHSLLEAELSNCKRLVATVNTDLLTWDRRASHPWMLVVTIQYPGSQNGGLPTSETAEQLNAIEDAVTTQLRDQDGYLNIGRHAAENERAIFYACIDFRKPSKVLDEVIRQYNGPLSIDYRILSDKYWQSVDHFRQK